MAALICNFLQYQVIAVKLTWWPQLKTFLKALKKWKTNKGITHKGEKKMKRTRSQVYKPLKKRAQIGKKCNIRVREKKNIFKVLMANLQRRKCKCCHNHGRNTKQPWVGRPIQASSFCRKFPIPWNSFHTPN